MWLKAFVYAGPGYAFGIRPEPRRFSLRSIRAAIRMNVVHPSPLPHRITTCVTLKKRLLHTRHHTPATSLVTNEAQHRLFFARNVMYRVNKRRLKLEQRLNNG